MQELHDPYLRKIFQRIFFVFIFFGIYGIAWISDDLDIIKMYFAPFITIPTATIFYFGDFFYSHWQRKFPRIYLSTLILLSVSVIPGHISLLNSLVGDQKFEKVSEKIDDNVHVFGKNRGSLGMLYTTRW